MEAPVFKSVPWRRASLPVCMEGSSRPETGRPPKSHQQTPHLISHGYLETFIHASCAKCHHWHDAISKLIPKSSDVHVDIECEKCGMNMFGLGRRSTHLSHLSQESRANWNRDNGLRQFRWACANARFLSQSSFQISPHTSWLETPLSIPPRDPTAQAFQEAEPTGFIAQSMDVKPNFQGEPAQILQPNAAQLSKPKRTQTFKLPRRIRKILKNRPSFMEKAYRRLGEILLGKEVRIRTRSGRLDDTQPITGAGADAAAASRISGTLGENSTDGNVTRYQQPRNDLGDTAAMLTSSPALLTVTETSKGKDDEPAGAESDKSPRTEIAKRCKPILSRRHLSSTRVAFINHLRHIKTQEAMKTACDCTPECSCRAYHHHHPMQRCWGIDSTAADSMDPQLGSSASTVASPQFPNQETDSPRRPNSTGVHPPVPAPTPQGSALQMHIGAGVILGFGSHSEHRDSGTSFETARSRSWSGGAELSCEMHSSASLVAGSSATMTGVGSAHNNMHSLTLATPTIMARPRMYLATCEAIALSEPTELSLDQPPSRSSSHQRAIFSSSHGS